MGSVFYALTSVGAFFILGNKYMGYQAKELSRYKLSVLRTIGRKVGVKSPSSLAKKRLIKEIIAIQNGIKEPYFSKRGRPCLNGVVIDNYANVSQLKDNKFDSVPLSLIEANIDSLLAEMKKKIMKSLIEKK